MNVLLRSGLVLKLVVFLYVSAVQAGFKTRNVIIVVIDGPRWTETWGDPSHKLIPCLADKLSKVGVINSHFRNEGWTSTNPGHAAVVTGNWQDIKNDGSERPHKPTLFEYFRKKYKKEPKDSCYVLATKDKLAILSYSDVKGWGEKYGAVEDCGEGRGGVGSGYGQDDANHREILKVLKEKHPRLVVINYKGPDSKGHSNDWDGYLKAIQETDGYLCEIWDYVQGDPFYKDVTTVFMTNDHGRHLDGVKDGFVNHGCDCEGCRHINFWAAGPDFQAGLVLDTPRVQIDICSTAAKLLNIPAPESKGSVMEELFLKNDTEGK